MFNISVYKYKNGIKRYYRYDEVPSELMSQANLIDSFMTSKGTAQWFYDEDSNNLGLVIPWLKDIGIYGKRHAVTKCDFDLNTGAVFYEQYFKEKVIDLPSSIRSMLQGFKVNQYSILVDSNLDVVEYTAYLHDIDNGVEGLLSFAENNDVELNENDTDNLGGIAIKWNEEVTSTSAYYWG